MAQPEPIIGFMAFGTLGLSGPGREIHENLPEYLGSVLLFGLSEQLLRSSMGPNNTATSPTRPKHCDLRQTLRPPGQGSMW